MSRSYTYADAGTLARWAIWLLYAQAGVALVALWYGWQEHQLLRAIDAQTYVSPSVLREDAEANERRQGTIGLVQSALFIVNGILILAWIWRANANARALGARRMVFTPGWAVGWFFVPFANLVMPYRALRETWRASARPLDPEAVDVPGLWFPAWWFFWLASNTAANVALRLALRGETVGDMLAANIASMVSDALSIGLCLVFPVILAQVQRMQTEGAQNRLLTASSAPA